MYDPSSLLTQAIQQGQPFIYVAVSYRVAGFGFMPGKEILADGSANLGLLDQRMALEWVSAPFSDLSFPGRTVSASLRFLDLELRMHTTCRRFNMLDQQ